MDLAENVSRYRIQLVPAMVRAREPRRAASATAGSLIGRRETRQQMVVSRSDCEHHRLNLIMIQRLDNRFICELLLNWVQYDRGAFHKATRLLK